MKTINRALLYLVCALSITSLSAQSLYQDALELADAIERHQMYLVVETDSIVSVFRETPEFTLEPVARLEAPRDSFFLHKKGMYIIQTAGLAIEFEVRYDTTSLKIQTKGEDFQINNQNLFAAVESSSFAYQIGKPNLIKIHAILGTHLDNQVQGINESYDAPTAFQYYGDNPYLSRLLSQEWFEKVDWLSENNLLSAAINTTIQTKKALYTPMFEKLYADSLQYDKQLLTIKGIQTEYKEPAIDGVEALVSTAEVLEASVADESVGFNTTTLIAGLSDFISERAQEEFNITFMDRFRERLNDPAYAELQVLFPASRNFLNQIDISNYKSALLSARQVFAEDVQKLSFNLPKIFELPKYESIQNIPEIYNLLIVYSVIDLIYRDNTMEDILPLTFRKVQNRFHELDKSINFRLAQLENASADRAKLTAQIAGHEQRLIQYRDSLIDKQVNLEFEFIQASLDPSGRSGEIDALYFDYYDSVNDINLELENAWDTIRQIPANLEGRLFYDDLMEEPSIEKYAQYFSEEPNPTELISAGLFLSRCMVNGVYGAPNKAQLLLEWDELLQRTSASFQFLQDSIKAISDWGINQKTDKLESSREELQKAILEDISFWKTHNATEHDSMALVYLSRTLNGATFQAFQGQSIIENLEIRQAKLTDIKQVLCEKLRELEIKCQQKSTLLQKIEKEGTADFEPILEPSPALLDLVAEAKEIRLGLKAMDTEYAKDLLKAKRNVDAVGKVMELASHLFLFLQTGEGEERTWLNNDQWNALMLNETGRDIYFGLLFQRMKNLDPSANYSNNGLAGVTTHFVYNLAQLKEHKERIKKKKEANEPLLFQDYFPYVKIAVSLINGILETPLMLDENQQAYSLAERDSALAFIPKISSHTLNLFENVNDKQFNFAIYNSLELYKIISERTLRNCDQKKGKDKSSCYENEKIRNGILVYGTFIADVALAQEPEDIRRALELVALPPGSSRLKRQNTYNVSINSYFGLGVGNERFTNPDLTDSNMKINSIGLTVPVGISASWKVKPEQKGSFTLFMPILDIGAVTAFRLDEEEGVLPELRFQNIISPGAYFLYNFQKSPFTLGLGTQYGPQLRKVTRANQEFETGAWRIMFTATVDVPLFNLFGNRY